MIHLTPLRNLKRAEEKVVSVREEIEEAKQQIEALAQKLKDHESEATILLQTYEKCQVT